jgi:2'-5' RNA ligase
MAALWLPANTASEIAVPGGEAPEQLHVTLAYMGRLSEVGPDKLDLIAKAIEGYCATASPMVGSLSGVGRFSASETSDGMDVVYASVDAPTMPEFRAGLVKAIEDAGVAISRAHGFTPHVTLKYVKSDDPTPVEKFQPRPVAFDEVVLAVGDDRRRFGIGGTEKAVERKKATEPPPEIVSKSLWVPILKQDTERRLVTGIVLKPEEVDAQGEVYDADTIEDAAHAFLADYNKGNVIGYLHKDMGRKLELVESWVEKEPRTLEGTLIKRGTWLITVHVVDDEVWAGVKSGAIRGFSIGGRAVARPVTESATRSALAA